MTDRESIAREPSLDEFICYHCKEGDCANCVGVPCYVTVQIRMVREKCAAPLTGAKSAGCQRQDSISFAAAVA